jgi:hypothetical protein
MAPRRKRGKLPAVAVQCTGCGHRWWSAARHQTPIHCPQCRHSVRVSRPASASVGAAAAAVVSIPQAALAPQPHQAVLPPAVQPLHRQVQAADDEQLERDEGTHHVGVEDQAGQRVDYVAELAARGWSLEEHGLTLCHLIELNPSGWAWGAPPRSCIGLASREIPGGLIYEWHLDALQHRLADA